jgi:hypothetical protein
MAIWQRGRRLFSTAAILMLVTAVFHTAGNLQSPPDATRKLFAEMDAYRIPLGLGMTPSMLGIMSTLVFTMSITFVALGALNLVLAAYRESTARLLRSAAWVNVLWLAAFVVLCWEERVPPPLVFGVVTELFAIGSLVVLSRKATHANA